MTIQYSVHHAVETIFDTLANFKKFGALHPFMTRVDEVGGQFQVEEIVRILGFIKIPNQYHVRVTAIKEMNQVVYQSQIKRSVSLEIVWRIAAGTPSLVTEEININANPIVKLILGCVMKKTHKQIMQQLNKL